MASTPSLNQPHSQGHLQGYIQNRATCESQIPVFQLGQPEARQISTGCPPMYAKWSPDVCQMFAECPPDVRRIVRRMIDGRFAGCRIVPQLSARLSAECPPDVCRTSAGFSTGCPQYCSLEFCRMIAGLFAGFSVGLFAGLSAGCPPNVRRISAFFWKCLPSDIRRTSGFLPADQIGRQGFGIWD